MKFVISVINGIPPMKLLAERQSLLKEPPKNGGLQPLKTSNSNIGEERI